MVSIFMFIEEWLAPNQKVSLLRNPRPQEYESVAFLFWAKNKIVMDVLVLRINACYTWIPH